jgi:hypothetical protein
MATAARRPPPAMGVIKSIASEWKQDLLEGIDFGDEGVEERGTLARIDIRRIAQARMSELERDMKPLAEGIIAAPATSIGGLRAKALVALWEALPAHAFHHGAFEFRDDGEASRSLFDAVAGMTGLTPLVRELEARLAADAEFKGTDA